MNSITNASPAQLRRAADIQERILDLQNQLNDILGAEAPSSIERAGTSKKRRKVSAAGRARMRAAQLARWAKIKGTEPSATPKRKRKLSAAGLANIRAGVAKRMAAAATKAAEKPKRKMSPALRAALERAWAARRAKSNK